jgi:cation diffusion facilitator family transporter
MNSEQTASHCHVPRFDSGNPLAEANIRRAFWLTAAMMVVEIAGGWWFNSMAVLADGWHMSSHALALGLSAFAYAFARRHAGHHRYAFGTWKIEVLGSYTSAMLLLGIVVLMAYQSIERLVSPQAIHYDEAIFIAVVGLAVNLVCAWWLRGHDQGHDHGGGHDHDHGHHHDDDRAHAHAAHHHDLNVRSAYLHVLADAATSVLAIIALLGGKYFGWSWLDPIMGLAGAVLVAVWAQGLLRALPTCTCGAWVVRGMPVSSASRRLQARTATISAARSRYTRNSRTSPWRWIMSPREPRNGDHGVAQNRRFNATPGVPPDASPHQRAVVAGRALAAA